jgi:hypothetical protein
VKTHAQGMLKKLRNGEDIFALLHQDGQNAAACSMKTIHESSFETNKSFHLIQRDYGSQKKEKKVLFHDEAYDDATVVEEADGEEDAHGGVDTYLHDHYIRASATYSHGFTSPSQPMTMNMNSGRKYNPFARTHVPSCANEETAAMKDFNQSHDAWIKVSPFTFSHCTTSMYHTAATTTTTTTTATSCFLPQTPISAAMDCHYSSRNNNDNNNNNNNNNDINKQEGPPNYTENSLFYYDKNQNDILLSSAAKILVEMSSPPAPGVAGNEYKTGGSILYQQEARNFTPRRRHFSPQQNYIHSTLSPSARIVSL